MHLIVKPSNITKEPTCGQRDRRTGNLIPEGGHLDDWMLEKRHGWNSVLSEMGQDELMGSIHCTRIPLILIAINQSHLSPLLKSCSANPLINPKTHFSTGAIELFFVMILSTPYAYQPTFYV